MKKLRHVVFSVLVGVSMFINPLSVRAEDVDYAVGDNGIHYLSIEQAWNAANSGTKITMQRDWDLESHLVVASGKEVTIEMNGYTIRRDLSGSQESGDVIYVNENAKLNLQGNNASETKLAYINKYGDSQSTTSGGLITGGYRKENGGGIYAEKKAVINLENVSIAGNRAGEEDEDGDGGGIYMNGDESQVNMNHAYVLDNYATQNGGGIYLSGSNSKITMTNASSVNNNIVEKNGGGIYTKKKDSEIQLSESSVIRDNIAYGNDGGGIYTNGANTKITLTGKSSIKKNKCEKNGGGIYAYDNFANIQLSGSSTIKENTASDGNGGGIYICYSFFTIESSDKTGVISGNGASKGGGAIYVEQKKWGDNSGLVSGLEFSKNSCGTHGGAIYLDQEKTTIRNCSIESGQSAGNGGGIYVNNDNNTIEDCTIINNDAGGHGGGVYCDSMNDISLKGKLIITNNTKWFGTYDSDLFLQNGFFTRAYVNSTPSKDSYIGINTDLGKIGINQEYFEGLMFYSNDPILAHIAYDSSKKTLSLADGGQEFKFSVTVNGKVIGRYKYEEKVKIKDTETDKCFKSWMIEEGLELSDLDNPNSSSTYFFMPAKNVSINSSYTQSVKQATLQVEAPTTNNQLPTKATLLWTDEDGMDQAKTLTSSFIAWFTEDGKKASGLAKKDTKYILQATLKKDAKQHLYFEKDSNEDTVKIEYINNDKADTKVASASFENSIFTIKGSPVTSINSTSSVSLNGNVLRNYKRGTTVEISAKQDNKVFVEWSDVQGVEFTDEQKHSETIQFTMPGNDVSLTASYKDYIENISLSVDLPQAGQDLPTTGILTWSDGSAEVPIEWISNGQKQTHAEYDMSYILSCSIAKDASKGIYFNSNMAKENVTITMNGLDGNQVASAILDEAGTLTLTSNPMYTESQPVEVASVQTYTITLFAQDEEKSWQEKETIQVHENEPIKIKAHEVENKTFVKWENVPEEWSVDDQTLSSDSISQDFEVTAIYKDEESLNTGSIFGNANQMIALVGIFALCGIGFVVYKKKK